MKILHARVPSRSGADGTRLAPCPEALDRADSRDDEAARLQENVAAAAGEVRRRRSPRTKSTACQITVQEARYSESGLVALGQFGKIIVNVPVVSSRLSPVPVVSCPGCLLLGRGAAENYRECPGYQAAPSFTPAARLTRRLPRASRPVFPSSAPSRHAPSA